MKSAKEFVCSVVHAGKSSENYVDTRFRICKNLKRKTSLAIPPDPDSVELPIKRATLGNIYMFIFLQANDSNS